MKKAILTIAMLIGFSAQAEQTTGLWERFCVQNKIGDACERAAKSINDQVSQFEADQSIDKAMDLQRRLQTVAEMGCKLGSRTSCESMEAIKIETLDGEILSSLEFDTN